MMILEQEAKTLVEDGCGFVSISQTELIGEADQVVTFSYGRARVIAAELIRIADENDRIVQENLENGQ